MSQALSLKAVARNRAGKGASRASRREGRVPAVVYGNKEEPTLISVVEKDLMKLLNKGHFMNSVVDVDVEGGATERTLPRDVQFHPVTDRPLHVDFLRLSADTTIAVEVPVRFVDETLSPGLKRGGVLNIVRHEIEFECQPDSIPDEIVISLKGRDINDSIHISSIELPAGVTPTIKDRDFTIATLVAPSGLKSDQAEGEGEAEAKA